jgi:hypothetical protein
VSRLPKSEQRCGNCNASFGDDEAGAGNVFCRERPPQVFHLKITVKTLVNPQGEIKDFWHSRFPTMDAANGWCRRWAAKDLDS